MNTAKAFASNEVKTVCRYCIGACGMIARIDDQQRITALSPDSDNALSQGYICSKGLLSLEAMYGNQRLLRPLKRLPDGRFVEIPLAQALDEIAARLGTILDESGGEAVGVFKGTQTWKNGTAHQMINDWLPAMGSTRLFTTITIDQSAKQVTMARMGYWDAGKPKLNDCDVMLIVGSNPLVSMSCANLFVDPTKRLKAALKRGMSLIVIDPRETETTKKAHCFIQPKPGEDPAIIAGLIHIILREGWHDREFCQRFVCGLDQLEQAVAQFTPAYVAERAGIDSQQLETAARLFARDNRKGIAAAGTGPSMAPWSNLADHLVECLNVICGRLYRLGDTIPNPGVQNPRRSYREEVIPPNRMWETGPKTSTGHGNLFGELMSGVLADEMLLNGEGRLRALIVNGGNPAAALPDQKKAVAGLENLDLLVAIEPYMTATARLCHYILPPKLQLERTDTVPPPLYEPMMDKPYVQYAAAITAPPPGAEVVDDWYPYWALAQSLGKSLRFAGVDLDMAETPTTESLLAIILRRAQVPFEEIKACTEGRVFTPEPAYVEPGRPDANARFEVLPKDVAEELEEFQLAAPAADESFTHTLIVRRLRGVMNSLGQGWDGSRRLHPFNPACFHPDDLATLGIEKGDHICITSDHGSAAAIAEVDASLRPGVVAMSHCWGGLPGDAEEPARIGTSSNLLVRTDRFVEKINAMPRMTAIPVAIRKGFPRF